MNKAVLTVTAANASITYGSALPAFTGTVTGAVSGDTFTETFSTTATATSAVGSYPITPAVTGANLVNYTVTTTAGTLTIGKATPVATWTPATTTINYGGTLDGTDLNATTTVAGSWTYTINGAPITQPLAAGSYAITATFTPTDATDYNGVTKTLTFTVNKAVLTVTAANASITYGSALPAFTGTVTGAVGGDTFTETFSTTATATSAVGSYPVTPAVTGANLANYTVTTTAGTLTIGKATPVATWTPATTTINYGGTLDGTDLNATTTVAGTWTYTINGAPVTQPLAAGSYADYGDVHADRRDRLQRGEQDPDLHGEQGDADGDGE